MAQDRLNQYADWLVKNKDKKGTPEFEKVAAAYSSLRTQPQPVSPNENNPDGTGVGRAFQRGALQTASAVPTMAANADYSKIQNNQKINSVGGNESIVFEELVRAGVPAGALQSRGVDLSNPQSVTALMNQYGVSPAAQTNMLQVSQKRISDAEALNDPAALQAAQDRFQANAQSASDLQSRAAALPMSPKAEGYRQALAEAPDGFKGWLGTITSDPLGFATFLGETITESGPQIAAGIGASAVTGNPAVGAGVMAAGGFSREYANEVNNFLAENGIDLKNDPKALFDNPQLMAKAQQRGLTRGLVIAAADLAGQGAVATKVFGGNMLKRTASQAASEGAGEALATAAVGDEISTKEVLTEAAAGGASTAVESLVANPIFNKSGQIKDPRDIAGYENQAAASLAKRLRKIANENGMDLKDVGSSGEAKGTLEMAHEAITEELKAITKHAVIKGYLDPKKAGTLDQLVDDYSKSQAAIRQTKNKVKSKVAKDNFDAIMRLLPETAEAEAVANLMRESNVLTDLFKNGTKGGLSQFTDTFNPFTREDGSYDPSKVISGMANKGVAIATGGASLPTQLGIAAAGRAIDKVTGRRSAIDRFVRQNENNQGLDKPREYSLIELAKMREQAALRREQADKDANAARSAQLAELPQIQKDNSPIGSILLGTGLDAQGLDAAMAELETLYPNNAALQEVFSDIRQNLGGDTNQIRSLNDIIPVINAHLNSGDSQVQRASSPDQALAARGYAQPEGQNQAPMGDQQFGPQMTTPENYNRGIEANQAMNRELVEGVVTDPDLSRVHKGRLITALDVLNNNLGSDPVAAATEQVQKLEDAGVPYEAIEAYIQPYVDRVTRQQSRPRLAMAPQEDVSQTPKGETTNIDLPNTLSEGFPFARDNSFRTGRDLKLALQERALAAQKAAGIDLSELSDENINRLADYLVADALEALKDNKNAIGWYDRTVTDALDYLSRLYPEIKTDPVARLQFTWALAVTSNGTKVDKNFELAADAYDHLQRTGRFPTKIGIGTAAKQIDAGLKMYHTMLEKFGGDHGLLEEFMNSQVPVKQIEKEYGVKISGEGKNVLVRGASILGPKIGNGFFSNLYGNFDALTMDRWLMRSVGRWRGTLVFINEPMIKKKQAEMKSILSNMDADTLKKFRGYVKPSGLKVGKTMSAQTMNDMANYIAAMSTSADWREGLNLISEDMRKVGNALAKYLDGQVEAPAGAKERDFIRSVFTQALGRLNEDPAVKQTSNAALTMSDLQALLWYPEKRLYDTSKAPEGQESRGYADDEAPDYANAARKLVETRAGMAVPDRLGSSGGTGDGRGGANSPNARQSQVPVSDGVAGVLAQRLSEGGPAKRASVPSAEEVKQAAAPVRAIIEVGKKGSKYEDGIKDIDQVRELADAINVGLKMYNDQRQMRFDAGAPDATDALGLYSEGIAYAAEPNLAGSEFQSYIVALHEVAHGLNDQRNNPAYISKFKPEQQQLVEGTLGGYTQPVTNKLTGRKELLRRASFDELIGGFLSVDSSIPKDLQKKVFKEIQDLQDHGKYRNGTDVRYVGGAKTPSSKRRSTPYYKYIRSAPEFAVDPVIYYLHDPKGMKANYPYTATMIKAFFDKSSKIRFYSHPLAMAFAVALATLLKAEQEDEQEKQLPAGLLTQQLPRGALST